MDAIAQFELQRLDDLNWRDDAIERIMRLRALQELSAVPSGVLLCMVAVITRLQEQGELDGHVKLYCESVFEDCWPAEQLVFTAFKAAQRPAPSSGS